MGQLKRNALSQDGSSMKLTIYYVKMCAHALARAHARSGDPACCVNAGFGQENDLCCLAILIVTARSRWHTEQPFKPLYFRT